MAIYQKINLFLLIFAYNSLYAQEIIFDSLKINNTQIIDNEAFMGNNVNRNLQVFVLHQQSDTTQYEYQLKGIEKKWKPYQHQLNLYYNELPGGEYSLIIRAKFRPEISKQIIINIKPLLWQKGWFLPSIYLILFLILGSILYFVFLYRLRQQSEMQQVRNDIARDLHDDIGSSLSSISLLSIMANKALDEKHTAKDFLNRIPDEVQRLSGAIDDMIWNIRPESDAIENIFERFTDYAAQTLESHKIDFKINFPAQNTALVFPMNIRRSMFLIYKEALNNITKHADCQTVTISASLSKSILSIIITDDGKGFDVQKPSNRNGLKNMRSRMEEIHGKFEIDSIISQGTRLTISFPLTQKGD